MQNSSKVDQTLMKLRNFDRFPVDFQHCASENQVSREFCCCRDKSDPNTLPVTRRRAWRSHGLILCSSSFRFCQWSLSALIFGRIGCGQFWPPTSVHVFSYISSILNISALRGSHFACQVLPVTVPCADPKPASARRPVFDNRGHVFSGYLEMHTRTGCKNAVFWPHSDRVPIARMDNTQPKDNSCLTVFAPAVRDKVAMHLE